MEIRKALKKDIQEIAEIFHIEAAKKPYLQKRTLLESIKAIDSHFKKANIYVSIIENKIIGFIIVRLRYNRKDAYIDEFWLKSKYQRKGIGKSIMNFIENEYKKEGVGSVTLIAGKKPGAAFDFYKKLKFKVVDNLALMKKTLN